MTMTAEREIMAVAAWIERRHGGNGPVFIADRIGELALRSDLDGINRWKAIAAAYDRLLRGVGCA